MMKVLITGANGQLGQDLVKVFSADPSYQVFPKSREDLDITNAEQVDKVLSQDKPELVIHAAAWTNVDAAAENPGGALKVNGEGTKNVCQAAKNIEAKVLYISTNEVFDGKKKAPYEEGDDTKPITPYGESKLAGEKSCQEVLGSSCTIVRTAWLYGPGSENNFPNKILKRATEQGYLKVVDDEIGNPTFTPDLARAIKELVDKGGSGIFHLVNEGQASRYDWAEQIVTVKNLEVPIDPIKLDQFDRPSKPPHFTVLANTRAKELGIELRPWQDACKEYLQKI